MWTVTNVLQKSEDYSLIRVGTEAGGVGITGIPLDREVGTFGTIDHGSVGGERSLSDSIPAQARAFVGSDFG